MNWRYLVLTVLGVKKRAVCLRCCWCSLPSRYRIGRFFIPGIFSMCSALKPTCYVALLRKIARASSKLYTCHTPCSSRSIGRELPTSPREVFCCESESCFTGQELLCSFKACSSRAIDMEDPLSSHSWL